MSYEGHGVTNALFRPVAQQQTGPGGAGRLIASGSMTEGRFGLFRADLSAHSRGPGAHFHRTFSESFYVLEGRVRIFDRQRWVDVVEGDFVHVAEGGIHKR